MTRAGTSPSPPGIADQLAADPVSTIMALVRAEERALTAAAIKQRLARLGVDRDVAKRAWDRAQPKIRHHDNISYQSGTYRWRTPAPPSPLSAVDRLATGQLPVAQRRALVAVVRTALEGAESVRCDLEQTRAALTAAEERINTLTRTETPAEPAERNAARRRAARERHARIDAVSRVAEIAAEVEELLAKGAGKEVVLQHVRALADDSALTAIGSPGQRVPFDQTHHSPVGDPPPEGSPVIVVRPGYTWNTPEEAVLISRAVVKRG